MFASLHCHDEFSLLDGAGTARQHAEAARDAGYVALASTNHATLAGSLHHMTACREAGIIPISGVECYYRPNRKVQGQKEWLKHYYHITLLAKDLRGWHNLMRISSAAHQTGFYGRAAIDDELLDKYHEGIICLTGCVGGRLVRSILTEDHRGCEAWIKQLKRVFRDDLFCEIMPHDLDDLRIANVEVARLAERHGIGVVTTIDAHYPTKEWGPTQDILLMIATNQSVKKREKKREAGEDVYEFTMRTFYHLTRDQIGGMYRDFHPDLSAALVERSMDDTLAVAALTTPFLVDRSEKMPVVSFPGHDDNAAYLRELSFAGLERRGYADDQRYIDQIEFELATFVKLNSVEQMLMAWDVIDWAKSDRPVPKRAKNGDLVYEGSKKPIMVGPGRGCLTGDVDVWTNRGFKPLSEISVGDQVSTHTGYIASVRKKFDYQIDEELVTIKCFLGDVDGVEMTLDHEVLVEKCDRVTNKSKIAQGYRYHPPLGNLDWVPARDIEVGDLVSVPIINLLDQSEIVFDLADHRGPFDLVEQNFVVERKPCNKPYFCSMRDISARYGIYRGLLKKVANGATDARVSDVLSCEGFLSDDEWRSHLASNRYIETRVRRFVKLDEKFSELMGFWAANGWLRSDSDLLVGWAERRSTSDGSATDLIEHVTGLFVRQVPHDKADLLQLEIRSRCWARLIDHLVFGYDRTALTKSVPEILLKQDDFIRRATLSGLWRGDGSVRERNSYSTSSKKLMHQVRTLLWSIGVGNGVLVDDRVDLRHEFRNRSRSWRIVANRRWDSDTPNSTGSYRRENMMMMRVRSIERDRRKTCVYDIEVDHNDSSYLTSSFAVHNSAAGSTVAWAVGITNVNPIKHRLLFERFLNPERVGKPDIDIDFSPDRVDEVEDYLKAVHGKDRVVDIIAHSTFGPRAALTDVGRVLCVPYDHVKSATKTIDDNEHGALDQLRVLNPTIERYATDHPEAYEHSVRIQGMVARKSEHAGGVLILPGPVEEYIPVERTGGMKGKMLSAFGERSGKGNALISDYGYNKLDVLRVAELRKQQLAVDLYEERTGIRIILDDLPVHDDPYACEPEVMQGFKDGLLVGVFQFSATASKLTRQVKPDNIFDLAAINALIRPGPRGAGLDQQYARRKNGLEEITYWHPSLEQHLDFSYGILAFQESLIEVVHNLGGLTRAQADIFRKIASKLYRDPAYARQVMGEWEVPIKAGMIERGLKVEDADVVWTSLLSFSDYSFNLAHADGYSLLAYRDMWLKVHMPREFYSAFLSVGLSQVTKKRIVQKAEAVREARHLGLNIMPPDINVSGRSYTVVDGGIRLGLEAIKNIGPAAALAIETHRPFESMADVERRVPAQALNVTSRASLVMSGACDRWGARDAFTEEHIDQCERDLLGMSLTSTHSIAAYADAIDGRFWTEVEFDAEEDGARVVVVGEVSAVKEYVDKKGGVMCFVDLVYGPNQWSCTLFSGLYETHKELVHSRRPLMIMGSKSTYNGRSSVRVEGLPVDDESDWVAPVIDLADYVEMRGNESEQLAADSVFPEDLPEQMQGGS